MRNVTIHLLNDQGEEIAAWSLPAPHPALGKLPEVVTWADTGRYFIRMPPEAFAPNTPERELEPRYRECDAPTVIGRL